MVPVGFLTVVFRVGFIVGSVLVLVIGVELIRYGLWYDRSNGRPRCPRCWYDMRGTLPRLECPECGHDAGQEEQCYRDRTQPWLIFLGVAMVCFTLSLLIRQR